jgi:hypothetical protein
MRGALYSQVLLYAAHLAIQLHYAACRPTTGDITNRQAVVLRHVVVGTWSLYAPDRAPGSPLTDKHLYLSTHAMGSRIHTCTCRYVPRERISPGHYNGFFIPTLSLKIHILSLTHKQFLKKTTLHNI